MARERIDPRQPEVVRFEQVALRLARKRRRGGGGAARKLRRFAGETRRDQVTVLDNVTFAVQPGESLAIVGAKGPARQAILRLAAGTLLPDQGSVARRERVLPMIDVARAMRAGYTVRQNVYLVGGLLGMTPDQVADALVRIVDECGAAGYLDRDLSGAPRLMRQKLAWSTSMAVDANAFAIDQMLVVGERAFRQGCWTKVDALREQGATFLIASDSLKQLQRFCDRAILLDGPTIVADTSVAEAVAMLRQRRRDAREQ